MNGKTVISFHRGDGAELVLGNGGPEPFHLLAGSQGLGVAPTTFASAPVPGGHGSLLRGKRLDERPVFIPVLLEAATADEADELREYLTRFVSPLDPDPLYLRVQTSGREKWRELRVHYSGGLDGVFEKGAQAWQTIGLEFRAFEALWRGEHETITKHVDPGLKPFLSTTEAFFPVLLADAVVDAQLTLDIAGDAPTFPVWTITPPGEDLLIVHTGTGQRFFLDGLITEPVTINMETWAITSATYPNGELWDRVSVDSTMFELLPGTNTLEFSMVGSTTDSMVHVTYQPRYLRGQ